MGNRAVYVYKRQMEEKQITEIRDKVAEYLDQERLKQAIETLGQEIESLQDWDLRTRHNEMQTAYRYMLEYLRMGMPDPDRERLHGELVARCYMLNDLIYISRLTEHSTKVYFQMRRRYKNLEEFGNLYARMKETYANIDVAGSLPEEECHNLYKQLIEEREKSLQQLFAMVWSSVMWSKGDAAAVAEFIGDNEIPANDRAVIVSAIMLGLIKCFEPVKLSLLCQIAASEESLLSTRAVVAVIIAVSLYDDRIKHYPEIEHALESLMEVPHMASRMQTVQIQLLRCRETQKIDRKMREEIIPAMMKNPKFKGEHINIEIIKEIEEDEDKNPEWKKWVESDNIKGKIEEMAKWQFEGADVYMSTFAQLKTFPFFGEIGNWFRPFDPTVPAIAELLPKGSWQKKSLISSICASPFFCNSDKYSFCFTFKQVSQEQRDMLMQQVPDEGEIAESDSTTPGKPTKEKLAEKESNQYIQDLYRFFKLSNFRHEFNDPFALPLNMVESKSMSSFAGKGKSLIEIFRYLVEKEYYEEAYNAGRMYEAGNECDVQFFQEMGYCLQKSRRYNEAIDYYTKADIIQPDTLWTMRHIAQCYRLQGELEKALSYYQLAEELAPENISLLLQAGESFASTKRYEEAFARFFKVEFLKPGSHRALRAIAWCSFMTGKDGQARNYYKKLMDMGGASWEDYLNAAHIEWVEHNNAKAFELYTKAKEITGSDKVAAQILNDKEILVARGLSEKEVLLLRDLMY